MQCFILNEKDVYRLGHALNDHAIYCDMVFDSTEFGDLYRDIHKQLIHRKWEIAKARGTVEDIKADTKDAAYVIKGDCRLQLARAIYCMECRGHSKYKYLIDKMKLWPEIQAEIDAERP